MLERSRPTNSQFASTFPARFAAALDEARGAMAGIAATAAGNGGLIPPEALQRLHEIYRLRIELEIETAGLLWRTAEVVCALTDAIDVLNRRARPVPLPPAGWLGGLARGVAERRRARVAIRDEQARRTARRPDLDAPGAPAEAPAPVPVPAGQRDIGEGIYPAQRWRAAA
jgi:hypothetical protein